MLTIFIASFATLLPPYFAKLLFDQGVALKEAENILMFGLLGISSYFLAAALQFGCQSLVAYTSNGGSVKITVSFPYTVTSASLN